MKGYKVMRAGVKSCPHSLVHLEGKLKKLANDLLPVTVGFEFENDCRMNDEGELYIDNACINADVPFYANDDTEQRFTIDKGIEGMCQLYDILEAYKEHYPLCENTGIHIHLYIPEKYQDLLYSAFQESRILRKDNIILTHLDKYKYTGEFNSRDISCSTGSPSWVRFNNNSTTIEFRIFKMTFDYTELMSIVMDLVKLMNSIYKEIDNTLAASSTNSYNRNARITNILEGSIEFNRNLIEQSIKETKQRRRKAYEMRLNQSKNKADKSNDKRNVLKQFGKSVIRLKELRGSF